MDRIDYFFIENFRSRCYSTMKNGNNSKSPTRKLQYFSEELTCKYQYFIKKIRRIKPLRYKNTCDRAFYRQTNPTFPTPNQQILVPKQT